MVQRDFHLLSTAWYFLPRDFTYSPIQFILPIPWRLSVSIGRRISLKWRWKTIVFPLDHHISLCQCIAFCGFVSRKKQALFSFLRSWRGRETPFVNGNCFELSHCYNTFKPPSYLTRLCLRCNVQKCFCSLGCETLPPVDRECTLMWLALDRHLRMGLACISTWASSRGRDLFGKSRSHRSWQEFERDPSPESVTLHAGLLLRSLHSRAA